MRSVSILTLGCKLNQLESEAIAGAFKQAGFEVRPPSVTADLAIINTCTVTSKAEQKARRIIRHALQENEYVIVTGCYAQLDRAAIAALDSSGRLFVVPGSDKAALMALPPYIVAYSGFLKDALSEFLGAPPAIPGLERGPFAFDVDDFSFHSRAFVKIQDGCDNHCAFCRASIARGKAVSLEAPRILSRLQALEQKGFAEAVITGLNVCQYDGGDSIPALGELLQFLLKGTHRISLRLSSLEPERLSPAFFEVIQDRRIRPHFHLSIQSGSPMVLRRMGRKYTVEGIEALVARLRQGKSAFYHDPFLAADIIAGFPGETDEDFDATMRLCADLGLAWIHAFPFSPRPGTAAAAFPGHVPESIATKRVEALTTLAHEGRAAYIKRWIGRDVEAIAEQNNCALSENYLNLKLSPDTATPLLPGTSFYCRLTPPPEPHDPSTDLFYLKL
jgi:threonylcarbamoyladenosine tRNA methylthiotransferase MtaB